MAQGRVFVDRGIGDRSTRPPAIRNAVATRRLAAILAADVAGYSRLMGADEEGTLNRLKAYRRELVDLKIREHHGRIVKTTGDGMLAEFSSVVDAVRCAVEIQRAMIDRNATVPEDKRIIFRVGINLGDVIADGDDIYGDGVNIAARLEALAEPGGVCISRTVRDHVGDRLPYNFDDIGGQSVKNIARPVHAYALNATAVASLPEVTIPSQLVAPGGPDHARLIVVAASIVAAISIAAAVWWAWPRENALSVSPPALVATSVQRAPANEAKSAPRVSIVVLPFASLSNDPEQEYFVDGITDDLTTDLSRIAGSFVIARNTAFAYKGKPVEAKQIARDLGVRYVLEGSIRRSGERIQVNVRLIDGETGAQVWADRFDTDRRDLAAAQSEITGRLARTLDIALVRDASNKIEQAHATEPDASDLVMRGKAVQSRFRPAGRQIEALALFERALELDPRSVEARVFIAKALIQDIGDGFSSSVQEDEARAEKLLLEAVEADPSRSWTHTFLGHLRQVQGRWDEALSELELAVTLDPNNSYAIRRIGDLLALTGKLEAAIPYIEKSLRLNPREGGGFALATLGFCYLDTGRIEGIGFLRQAISENPKIFWFHLRLAAALGLKGDIDGARAEIAESLKLKPQVNSIAAWRNYLGLHVAPQLIALMDQYAFPGLRRAGFPEE